MFNSKSLYSRIQAAWDARWAGSKEIMTRDECPPHLQALEDEGRRLDQQLSDAIKEKVDMWQDGMISAVELTSFIVEAALSEE